MKTPSTVSGLKPAAYNPRRIDPEAAAGLAKCMAEFGDLGGIVYNVRTRRLVTAHQRREQLPSTAKLVRTDDHTDDVGTVGYGYVEAHGTRWPVRFVDWNEQREKAANVAANNPHIAGEFTEALGPILEELAEADADLVSGLRLDVIEIPEDPQQPPDNAGHSPEDGQADTQATIGRFRFSIPRADYEKWVEEIRQKRGFEDADVVKEIRRRLRI